MTNQKIDGMVVLAQLLLNLLLSQLVEISDN